MNHNSINSKQPICIWTCGVTFDKLLVSWLDRLFIQYDTKPPLALSTDTRIHIKIQQTAAV